VGVGEGGEPNEDPAGGVGWDGDGLLDGVQPRGKSPMPKRPAQDVGELLGGEDPTLVGEDGGGVGVLPTVEQPMGRMPRPRRPAHEVVGVGGGVGWLFGGVVGEGDDGGDELAVGVGVGQLPRRPRPNRPPHEDVGEGGGVLPPWGDVVGVLGEQPIPKRLPTSPEHVGVGDGALDPDAV